MVGRVALYQVLRFLLGGVVHITLDSDVRSDLLQDNPANSAGFGVPLDMIAAFVRPLHDQFCAQKDRATNLAGAVVSVTTELLRSNVIFIYARFCEHFSRRRYHRRRTGDVIDRPLEFADVLCYHFPIHEAPLPRPVTL